MGRADTGTRRHGEIRSPRLRVSASPRLLVLLLTAHCSLLTASAATWTRQSSGTMAWLHAVYFLDQNHGWVAGSNGTLLETLNGGANWEKLSVRTTDTLRDVY